MYIEIYQFLAALALIAAVTAIVSHGIVSYQANVRLQKGLSEAWSRQRLAELRASRLDTPEDWELRGTLAEWEVPAGTTDSRKSYAYDQLAVFRNEELAEVVLRIVQARISYANAVGKQVDVEKVFTRMAGRVFRIVEKNRKARR